MTTGMVSIPRRALARWRSAMALIGLGLATTMTGLAWDFYVHEIAREITSVESMFAPPHILIFAGFAICGLGFLAALPGIPFRAAPQRA